MNRVCIIGNLTKDVELRYTQSQLAVATFTVAINRPKKANDKPIADYIRVKTFGKIAENCDKFLSKGKKVGVEGSIATGSYDDKEGRKVYTTDVIASNVEFLTPAGKTDDKPVEDIPQGFEAINDEDIPF